MGFTNFFKKIIRKEPTVEYKPTIKELTFNEIKDLIKNKETEINTREKEVFVLIKNRASSFVRDINHKVRNLESTDVESKDTNERIKSIVKTNLNKYIEHVKKLIEEIDNLNEDNFEHFIKWVNNLFIDFEKKSYVNYHRAVFLIGQDLIDIRKNIADFSKSLISILDKNKEIIGSSRQIHAIQQKIKQVFEANEVIKGFDERINLLNDKTKDLEKINQTLDNKIKEIKENKSHKENIRHKEKIKETEKNLKEEIHEFKGLIDFKELGNIFHSEEKKTKIIRAYKERFEETYLEDNGASIFLLLDEAKLNTSGISLKIKQINTKREELIVQESTIKKDETEDLLIEINKIKLEIEKLKTEKDDDLKKSEKIKQQREKIISSIKQELAKMNK